VRVLVPFCRGLPQRAFYQDFHQGIVDALRELGHEPLVAPFAKMVAATPEDVQTLYPTLARGNVDALLDLCCWGCGLSHFAIAADDGRQQPLFERFDIPWAGMLFDHPYNQAIHAVRAPRVFATYPDLGHFELVRLVYPGLVLAGEMFTPPAIRPENDRSTGADRAIDVLYVGNLERRALARFWREDGETGAPDSAIRDAIADAVLAEPERSLHLSVRAAIEGAGAPAPLPDPYNALRAVEWHLRAVFRRDAVVSLARSGVRMRVVGAGWDALDLPANVERTPQTDYEGLFRLAGRARICLDASTYLDGANDRVFGYAQNGAVCFTNAAGYLRREFGDGSMRFYSMARLAGLADGVRELLARPAELRAAGDAAREKVLALHTWRDRIAGVLAALRGASG
jgi:glycosyl transferase family 1